MANALNHRWIQFVNRHLKICNDELFCYHYTSKLEALKGIAGERKLWFSSFEKLNDALEVSHGLEFIDNAITNYMVKAKNNSCRTLLAEVQYELKERKMIKGGGLDNFYFFSFTRNDEKNEDDTHWRIYANNGEGFALKFKLQKSPQVLNVFYLDVDKVRVLEEFFSVIDPEVDKVLDITYYLIKIAVLFKHPDFQSESELRVVASLNEGEILNDSERLVYSVDDIENIELKEIICGPNNHLSETSPNEIKKFFKEEYTIDIEVSKSMVSIKKSN